MKKLIFLAAVAAIGMVACNRIGDMVNNTDSSVSQNAPTNIMRFDSYEALSREIDRTLEMMSMSDRLMRAPGQGTNGFVSFGELADMAYENVAQYQDDYKSIEDVRAAVAQHSNYLQLVQDENGEYFVETKLSHRATKYVINEDKMYQVQDTLIKVLENGIVQTTVDKYNKLMSINEENVLNFLGDKDIKVAMETDLVYGQEKEPEWPCYSMGLVYHLNKIKMNYDVKTIKVGNYNRDHMLRVWVRIQFLSYTQETLSYMLEGFRKGIANRVYWAFGHDTKFDLTVTIAQASIYQTQAEDYICLPKYNANGIASGFNSKAQYIRSFLPNANYMLEYLNYNNNVFLRTRGYAHFTGEYSNVYVPFNFN